MTWCVDSWALTAIAITVISGDKKNRPKDPEHQEMLTWIKKMSASSHYTYGSRRIRKSLNALGYPVGIRKTKRLMKEANVFVRYRKKYKVNTNSKHSKPLFENILNREFKMMAPDRAYASDITYIHTQEGWLYLAIVIDLFSRKVVGWRMSSRMKAELVCDALKMAICRYVQIAALDFSKSAT